MKQVLAVDIGFGNTKAVWGQTKNGNKESWSEIVFPSVAPVSSDSSEQSNGLGVMDRVLVPVAGKNYYVGPEAMFASGLRELHENYIERPEYTALLAGSWHYMLKRSTFASKSIDTLVLGLPVSGYKAHRAALKEMGQKTFQVPVPIGLRSKYGDDRVTSVVAKNVIILPQPYGALMYAMEREVANEGELFRDDSVALVIDPGYSTFDWFVAKGGTPQLELCDSFQGGVSKILQAVSARISQDHGIGSLNFSRVEQALADGVLNIGTKKIDMAHYKELVSEVATKTISEFMQRFPFETVNVCRIFMAGGGASFYIDTLRERLSSYQVELLPDSLMSNARGFWLAGSQLSD